MGRNVELEGKLSVFVDPLKLYSRADLAVLVAAGYSLDLIKATNLNPGITRIRHQAAGVGAGNLYDEFGVSTFTQAHTAVILDGFSGNSSPLAAAVPILFLTGDEILRCSRGLTDVANGIDVVYTLILFDNRVKQVTSISIPLAGGSTSDSQNVVITDLTKCVLFYGGAQNDSAIAVAADCFCTLKIENATEVWAGRYGNVGNAVVKGTLVEFE